MSSAGVRVAESFLPSYVDLHRYWEDEAVREIDNFLIYALDDDDSDSEHEPSTTNLNDDTLKLVTLEDISSGEHDIVRCRGNVKSQNPQDGPDVPCELSPVLEWSVEFGSTMENCGVWVFTENEVWYKLITPHPRYLPLYEALYKRFLLTTRVFFTLYEDVTADFIDIVQKLDVPESELIAEADFISTHLRSDPLLKRAAFIRVLLQKQRQAELKDPSLKKAIKVNVQSKYYDGVDSDDESGKIGSKKSSTIKKKSRNLISNGNLKKRSREVKEEDIERKRLRITEEMRRVEEEIEKLNEEKEMINEETHKAEVLRREREKKAKEEAAVKEKERRELRKKELHYQGVSFETYQQLPAQFINESGRLFCLICQKTFARTMLRDFIEHLHKHRTIMLGAFNERERTSLRVLSFLNQLRVRAIIESLNNPVEEKPLTPQAEADAAKVLEQWPTLTPPPPPEEDSIPQ